MPSAEDEKILCQTPSPGKKPTRIARWKYELVRRAVLAVVPQTETGIPFKQLPDRVVREISPEELDKLGSPGWYTTTVKLDLEVRGEIERVPGSVPQRLRKPA